MTTEALTAIGPNHDLQGVRLPDVATPIPAKDYTPGAGYTFHVASAGILDVGGVSMRQLAYLHQHPEHPLASKVTAQCSQKCGETFEVMRLFAGITACDPCRAKVLRDDNLRKAKAFWEKLCPPIFRETDKTHAGFPRAQYEATRGFCGEESLFLFGPTRTGKTRLAVWLLKRCMVSFGKSINILWPTDLKTVRAANVNRTEWIAKWGSCDVLLWDDSLLTGAQDERITDALKDLLDHRMNWKRHNIFTSQIGGAEYKSQADKFDNVTAADLKRVEAFLRRLREVCRVISFAEAQPKAGEDQF